MRATGGFFAHNRPMTLQPMTGSAQSMLMIDDDREPCAMMPGMSGLGLAIARGAAELHGGSIIARNMPGGGLKVEIRLPSEDAVQ